MTHATLDTSDRTRVVALAFAMVVSMWSAAYVCRLPAVMAPSWLLLGLILAVVVAWGIVSGRRGGGWVTGLAAGAIASVVNMLILGSLLASPDTVSARPAAIWWIPGSILLVAGVAAGAAAMAGPRHERSVDGRALLAKVAVAATFLLVVAGGLVTSNEAGLAVVDWPNTFGYNMFLYPLSRMTGGIYFEHAHRLFGALVGLTTVVLAVVTWRRDDRTWVRRLALIAVGVVILQGILGGLRVTGRFTLSTSPDDMAPSIVLAIFHGVLGQVFLALIVILAAASSVRWRGPQAPVTRPSVPADRQLQLWFVIMLLVQLVFGAIQRHVAEGILIHVTLAAVVTMFAVAVGARAWGLYHGVWPVQRLGQVVMGLVAIQVTLGIATLAVTQGRAVVGHPTTIEVTLATAHQACGALLLAAAVLTAAWSRRALQADSGHPVAAI
jgi:cytochrome c oxidase assembly protein subunit 15